MELFEIANGSADAPVPLYPLPYARSAACATILRKQTESLRKAHSPCKNRKAAWSDGCNEA